MSANTLPDARRAVHITDTIQIERSGDPEFDPEPTTIGRVRIWGPPWSL